MKVGRGIRIFRGIAAALLLGAMLAACSNDSSLDQAYADARAFCVERGGTIGFAQRSPSDAAIEQCVVTQVVEFDVGQQAYTHRCEMLAYRQGRCDERAERSRTPPFLLAGPATTVREQMHATATDILSKLRNTGYAHDKDGNFLLRPGVQQLRTDGTAGTTDYNLFLDCSGFVGYYVLQAVSPDLYAGVPRNYMCARTPRPLASDFADVFGADRTPLATASSELPAGATGGCWARVDHVSRALPGDILVYRHPENIGGVLCCYEQGGTYQTVAMPPLRPGDWQRDCVQQRSGRLIRELTGNSGHILFVLEAPKLSTGTYDDKGELQWIVHVADSTTSPHSFDSRNAKDEAASQYGTNVYHAWSRGADPGTVERCTDGTYQRRCATAGRVMAEAATIDTIHESNPTGIGAGVMYVDHDMQGYRTAYTADHTADPVYIGRPVRCP